jgi:hypothetical protein
LIFVGAIALGTARWRASKSRIVALSSAPTLWSIAAVLCIASAMSSLNLFFAVMTYLRQVIVI